MDIIFILAGLSLLFVGGEWLIKGAVGLSLKIGLSTLIVSTVVIGFGTSTPELLVSVEAALGGTPDIALGNVIGSNTANTLLIMGAAAVITPVICTTKGVGRDAIAVVLISASLAALALVGEINRLAGLAMIAALVAYLIYCLKAERKASLADRESMDVHAHHTVEDAISTEETTKPLSLSAGAIFALAGLAFLAIGAKLLVTGAVSIAQGFGVPEAIIGLTLVAVGTSLPELATAIAAARKGHTDVVIGNVLGSNIYNILGILGITSIITPIPFTGQMAQMDVWFMLATAFLLLPAVFMKRKQLEKWQGALFLLIYAGYIAFLYAG